MALKFGYWMPLGSGGFVISNIKQRTDWSLDYNAKLAQTAEDLGFEYGLAPARFLASHGWELQQEAITCTAVLAAQTKKLKLISAVHTGFWHPAMVAKMLATIDVYSGGRAAINVLTGWFKDEFRAFGEPWLIMTNAIAGQRSSFRFSRDSGRRNDLHSKAIFTASTKVG